MNDAENLRGLIESIESLSGADSVIDAEIWYAIDGKTPHIAAYTSSMDAAISLLPEGAIWRKFTDASMSTYAASPFNAKAQVRHDGMGATPALQLCAAALRVRLAPLEKIEAAERRKAVA